MVDKNLFLHDLSVVAILKNEAPYLKEWIEYHLLTGVEHFYLYDNESPDNQAEVVKPYVEAGLVDYIPAPGKAMQMFAYNDAAKRFKFFSRYMAFIDGDEFIFPKSKLGGGIVEVVDEILAGKANAAGLAINWQLFGSNGQEKADYSRGVLERFTRRAPNDWTPNGKGNAHVKTIANPRRIKILLNPHFPFYFEGCYSVNENGGLVQGPFNEPVTAEKIVMHHYHTKSREEYRGKRARGIGDRISGDDYSETQFNDYNRNEEFDDSILEYREARVKIYQPIDMSRADERLFAALAKNLSLTLLPTTPPNFYVGKMETFLTCRAVATYLKTKLTDDTPAKFFEEASLKAVLNSLNGMTLADAQLLIRELPNLLRLPYPVVKELRDMAIQIISQLMNIMRTNLVYGEYFELSRLLDFLKLI